MKKLILLLTIILCSTLSAQKVDSGTLLSGNDLLYVNAAEKEVEVYLKNTCHQINAAKRAMILEYGLLDAENVKQNVVGLKKVQGWNAVMRIKYNCTEKDYYDYTQFFNLKTK